MNLMKLRALQHVYRFNFHHVNHRQSVAEHSFYVAIYAKEFAKAIGMTDKPLMQVIVGALEHDFEEAVIGDIPYLVRRSIPDEILKDLADKAWSELGSVNCDYRQIVQDLIETADAYELKVYLEEERRSGNTGLLDIERETYTRLLSSKVLPDKYLHQLQVMEPKDLPLSISHEGE